MANRTAGPRERMDKLNAHSTEQLVQSPQKLNLGVVVSFRGNMAERDTSISRTLASWISGDAVTQANTKKRGTSLTFQAKMKRLVDGQPELCREHFSFRPA